MRKRYIQHPQTHELIPAEEYISPRETHHFVMGDIEGYRSMVDGSYISSRSKHRAHLKQHGCIEIGNETKHLKPYGKYQPPKGLKETIIRLANEKLR